MTIVPNTIVKKDRDKADIEEIVRIYEGNSLKINFSFITGTHFDQVVEVTHF